MMSFTLMRYSKRSFIQTEGIVKNHLNTLFDGVDFQNKSFLDIGGGSGLHSFYAACKGAKEVVCLEPEAEGSNSGVNERFQKVNSLLKLKNVILESQTIQAFEPGNRTFDIILLHNSINHIDETACINLLNDDNSKSIYSNIFSKISVLSVTGAKIIICDCSRYNFFALLRIRNPFVSTIEWHKHQAPEIWAQLLSNVGFVKPKISWSSFNTLGRLGKVISGNKLMSYFLMSHFCLTMEKPSEESCFANNSL